MHSKYQKHPGPKKRSRYETNKEGVGGFEGHKKEARRTILTSLKGEGEEILRTYLIYEKKGAILKKDK